ncbi:MAG: nitroreductase family protein [Methanobacteriota archaeon]|nr:MAG: nitroreductase family protein [Euryarchaeota archaeon]
MEILPEIRNRESPVVFGNMNVESEKIDALIEAARWAPSCFNNQSWNYVFVSKEADTREALEEALSRGNAWAKRAPYLVAVGADPEATCKTNGLPYYAYDVALSVMTLVIEAEHQGLRVHQMSGWNEEKVKEAVGFPENYRAVVVFALGYEGDPEEVWDELDERMRERVKRTRTRKASTENFFHTRFGQS